jgi:O-methyltransferase involved in polyketide biosynthesis
LIKKIGNNHKKRKSWYSMRSANAAVYHFPMKYQSAKKILSGRLWRSVLSFPLKKWKRKGF